MSSYLKNLENLKITLEVVWDYEITTKGRLANSIKEEASWECFPWLFTLFYLYVFKFAWEYVFESHEWLN